VFVCVEQLRSEVQVFAFRHRKGVGGVVVVVCGGGACALNLLACRVHQCGDCEFVF
jgi:hypothetical protein